MSVSDIVEPSHPHQPQRLEMALNLAVLGTLATQPLFGLLGRQPEFFAVRGSHAIDLVALTGGLFVVLPALLFGFALWVSTLPRPLFLTSYSLALGTLVTLVVSVMAKRAFPDPPTLPVGIAVIAGIIAARGYWRWEPWRRFLTYVSPAILILPCVFLLRPGVAKVMGAGESDVSASTANGSGANVVLLVFDGLPLTSLMATDGSIDEIRYPNFAALAREATWYRRATTVSDNTIYAVPAILSGEYPEKGQHPTLGDHPQNLFTLLGSDYRYHVAEPVTHLCPASLCGASEVGFSERMSSLSADLWIVYLHIVLPNDWTAGLPSISQGWSDFAENVEMNRSQSGRSDQDSAEDLREFIDQIEAHTESSLHFIHSLLPHPPTRHYSSGTRYTSARKEPSGEGHQWGRWSGDDWAVLQSYQRHLLQVEYVDHMLGRLVANLKTAGIYDSALLVVTADHGASFRAGDSHRALSQSNLIDILPVPLFVKTPNQIEGRIDDSDAETVDVLPTMAGVLGVELPWSVSGWNLDGGNPRPRHERTVFSRQRLVFASEFLDEIGSAIERKVALFGDSATTDLFQIGPHPEIIGRRPEDFPRLPDRTVKVGIHREGAFDDIDTQSGFVPGEITGFAVRQDPTDEILQLAIAVNGTIRATTQPYESSRGDRVESWAVLIEEEAFQQGANSVKIFMIEESGGNVALSEPVREKLASFLNTRLGVKHIVGVRESGFYTSTQRQGEWLRWTDGDAQLLVPLGDLQTPRALLLELHKATPTGLNIELKVNGSTVLSETITHGRWQRMVILDGVPTANPTKIQVISDTRSRQGLRGERHYGVAVKGLWLLDEEGAKKSWSEDGRETGESDLAEAGFPSFFKPAAERRRDTAFPKAGAFSR